MKGSIPTPDEAGPKIDPIAAGLAKEKAIEEAEKAHREEEAARIKAAEEAA